MAIVTVGFGQDQATITAGVGAANEDDIVEVHDEDANGNRIYREVLAISKKVTVQSDDPKRKYIVVEQVRFTALGTLRHCVAALAVNSILVTVSGPGTVTVDACHIRCASAAGILIQNNSDLTIIIKACQFSLAGGTLGSGIRELSVSSLTTEIYNCTFFGMKIGVRNTASTIFTLRNSAFYECATDFSSAPDTASHNATTKATMAGTNNVVNLTKAGAHLAWHFSPAAASLGPWDFRNINHADSTLQDAGTPVAGVTTDYDDDAFDDTNPNIGCAEEFTGFATAGPTTAPQID